jgi:Cdc6-like AAA superfamily ATPase
MAYLSLDYGNPVAIISEGDLDGEVVHVVDPDVNEPRNRGRSKKFNELKIPDGKVFPIPSDKPENLYISGPNGSGKSYYTAQWLKLYRKLYPKVPIYLFSDVAEDSVLDKIKNISRIILDQTLVDDPIIPEQLRGSVCVFDDIDSIADKNISKAVNTLRDTLLKTSRHYNIYVIVTNHLSTDYKNTRVLINESRSITVFPKSGASNQITRIFKEYCGITQKQLDMIMKLPSRWVTLHKNYPLFITYEHGIILL